MCFFCVEYQPALTIFLQQAVWSWQLQRKHVEPSKTQTNKMFHMPQSLSLTLQMKCCIAAKVAQFEILSLVFVGLMLLNIGSVF